MPDEHDILKSAWAPTGDCPQLPMLLDAFEAGDAAVRAHVNGCPRCAAEIALFRDVTSTPAIPGLRVPNFRPRPEPWWKKLFRPMVLTPALAAAATVAIVIGISVQTRTASAPLAEGVDRAGTVELVSPKGEIAAPPAVLQWNAVPGASAYTVRLLEVDRNILWEIASDRPQVSVPASVQKQVLPGKRLIWTVDALNQKRERMASGTGDFRLALAGRNGRE